MRYFFGLPSNYDYKFQHRNDTVMAVLSRLFGVKVGFLCNSYGGIYNGDVYFIDQEVSEEEFCILRLTHGFDRIDNTIAENYIAGKRR